MKIIVYKNYTDIPPITENTEMLIVPITKALSIKPKEITAVTFMGGISKDEINQVKAHWGMHR